MSHQVNLDVLTKSEQNALFRTIDKLMKGNNLPDDRTSKELLFDTLLPIVIQSNNRLRYWNSLNGIYNITKEELEEMMQVNNWREVTKTYHRKEFTGKIEFATVQGERIIRHKQNN